jgi:3'-5' exoribonuclease
MAESAATTVANGDAMTATPPAVVRLSELTDGVEAICFALLANKTRGMTKRNEPYVKCFFRDKFRTVEAPLWSNDPLMPLAIQWMEGLAYRLHVRAEQNAQFGLQLKLLEVRAAEDADEADGYDLRELVESSRYTTAELAAKVYALIDRCITKPHLNRLVKMLLDEHGELFRKMPAAQNMHHSYTAGLLEHVWSMTRISTFVSDHYANYYYDLNPPINKGIVVAASILHDIGKVRELKYHPVEAKYTKEGCLIGHVLMGRDMVREAAGRIDGFPEEDLLLLEHAILAHHGKREFGAPILPQTIEALIVSFVDDLDAKINAVARERLRSGTEGEFTDRVYPLDNRRIYKGVPVPPPDIPGDLAF